MDTRKDASKKIPEPQKVSKNPESVELSVEELEERVSPIKITP
jgi:hypothetical protein